MTRTWTLLTLSGLLAVTLTSPVPAGGEDDKLTKAIEKQLQALKDSLQGDFAKVREDFTAIRADMKKDRDDAVLRLNLAMGKLESFEKTVRDLQNDLEALKKRIPSSDVALYPPRDRTSMQEIQNKLTQIEETLTRLQGSSRISMSPPAASTGRVVMVNNYSEDMLYLVNGRSYRVNPGASAVLDNLPSGSLSYEVISETWGRRGGKTTTLAPNETITITTTP